MNNQFAKNTVQVDVVIFKLNNDINLADVSLQNITICLVFWERQGKNVFLLFFVPFKKLSGEGLQI